MERKLSSKEEPKKSPKNGEMKQGNATFKTDKIDKIEKSQKSDKPETPEPKQKKKRK